MSTFSVSIVEWENYADELTTVRNTVFILEQEVPPDLEIDPMDIYYTHALARDQNGQAIGTGRLLDSGKIGRMAVLKHWRGKGVGHALLHALIDVARNINLKEVELDSQVHAQGFYQQEGFNAFGDEFVDAGILHIKMKKSLFPE